MKNCYIHIPFCSKICSYCDFCKMFYNKKFVSDYLEALDREIYDVYRGEELETIYIGGGTPSSLDISELKKLFSTLEMLDRSNSCEFTIECNIENTDEEKIKLFSEVGINRISFGVESFNKNNLSLLERDSSYEKVVELVKLCRKYGINNINVDLMYALPDEDIEVLRKDLEMIFSLDVEHISTYSLIIEDHTKLSINGIKNISEDLDSEMYDVICNEMKNHGYSHYEISNFCKKGYESRHNLCYWNNKSYYGFGLGASGYIDNRRYSNTRSLNEYIDGNIILEEDYLTDDDIMEYEVILNLRKKEGISLNDFYSKYEVNFSDVFDYKYLVEKKLLILENNHLYIPEDKWYISNEIIVKLLEGEKYE